MLKRWKYKFYDVFNSLENYILEIPQSLVKSKCVENYQLIQSLQRMFW